ncbi:MAG TPA: hypothetical protein VF937_04590, partial [Chloroflexota bacterium]
MSRWFVVAAALGLLAAEPAAAQQAAAPDAAAYVDPFIGTAPAASASYGLEFDGGDVFPGA